MASWRGSMQSALFATLARPEWWAMALAAFLVRGGFLLILLPIVALPTTAALMTAIAPTLEALYLGRPSIEGVMLGAAVVATVLAALALAGLAGSWLDLALVHEAAADEELELEPRPTPARPSAWQGFAIRLAAHVPTVVAFGYGLVRVVAVAFEELTAPGETGGTPVTDRVLGRVPDAVLVVVLAWLVGETVGGLAARRAAAGRQLRAAFGASVRQLIAPRGLATLLLTSTVLVAVAAPFLYAAGRAWEHLRGHLLGSAEVAELAAALVLLVATWILGLAIMGATLAWRATAWTAEVTPD